MENKSYSQIIGSANAPYINRLARECGLAANFSAETSPSLPNYIAMTSGSTQGITDDGPPSVHRLTVPSIFSQTGNQWRGLAESMPSNCFQTDSGLYAVRHNPAAYYGNISGACSKQDLPLTRTVRLDARFTFVAPNLCNDMHACPTTGDDEIAQTRLGDKWLAGWLPGVLSSRNYVSRSTAIFVTWDESAGAGEHVATVVISPSTPRGAVSRQLFNHYSLLRTTEEMLGLRGRLGNAASAASMRSAFHALHARGEIHGRSPTQRAVGVPGPA
jgi:hypothetical protein